MSASRKLSVTGASDGLSEGSSSMRTSEPLPLTARRTDVPVITDMARVAA